MFGVAQTACGGPTMTVADWIRSLSDIELAQLLYTLLHERDLLVSKKLAEQCIQSSVIEMPIVSLANHLRYLRSPMNKTEED
jgi:hypothetical protein